MKKLTGMYLAKKIVLIKMTSLSKVLLILAKADASPELISYSNLGLIILV